MKVLELQNILSTMKETDELAIVFFEKEEAEQCADMQLTDGQWSRIVTKWTTNKTLNQVADETFDDAVWAITAKG